MQSMQEFPETPYKTDWLGSNAVFYDLITSRAAPTFNQLLDGIDVKPDLIGISNYLNYGFSVFGRTVVENIRITDPNSILRRLPDGTLSYEVLRDPVLDLLDNESSVEVVEDLLGEWFNKEFSTDSSNSIKYILPLSGGLDSTLLAWFLREKNNVYSFTYGISWFQKISFEVVNARLTAKKLDINWKQIKLGKFHMYMTKQHTVYGATMHAHSMYHFEFYTQVIQELGQSNLRAISGIYGDLWSGSWNFDFEPHNALELRNLAIRHGIYSEKLAQKFQQMHPTVCFTLDEDKFIEDKKAFLSNSKYRIVTAARIKMSLIRHLIDTPTFLGINVRSPFLDINIAMNILNLPENIRADRAWQKTFLKEKGILPKNYRFADYSNNSDFYACYHYPPDIVNLPENISFLPSFNIQKLLEKTRVSHFLLIAKLLKDSLKGFLYPPFLSKLLHIQQQSYVDLMLLIPLLKTFSGSNRSRTKT